MPALPKLLAINGSAPAAGLRVDASGGLTLSLGAAGGALVELRPFGATVVVSCAVPTNASTEALVTVPRALLAHLLRRAPNGANGAVSVEVARRCDPHARAARDPGRPRLGRGPSTLAVELRP